MKITALLKELFNIMFDKRCIFCNSRDLDKTLNFICSDCLDMFETPFVESCPICRHPLRELTCPSCKDLPQINFDSYNFIQYYTGYLKKTAHIWKREENFMINRLFRHLLISKGMLNHKVPVTVVPDSPAGKIRKGRSGLNYLLSLLKREGYQIHREIYRRKLFSLNKQKKSSRKERLGNISSLYYLPEKNIGRFEGEIYLIDDIFTTGSTLNYGAKLLKRAGFSKVHIISLFRTPLNSPS